MEWMKTLQMFCVNENTSYCFVRQISLQFLVKQILFKNKVNIPFSYNRVMFGNHPNPILIET